MRTPATERSVIAGVYRRAGIHDPLLRRGFEECRRATRAQAEIEYAVSHLLPAPLRIAAWALCGAGAVVDCLADEPVDPDRTAGPRKETAQERAGRLEAWMGAFDRDLRVGRSSDPVRQALLHTMLTWNLSPTFMYSQFTGVQRDVDGRQFATWQEWRHYCGLVYTPFALRTGSLLLRTAGLSAEPETLVAGVPEAALAWRTAVEAIYLADTLVDLCEDLDRGYVRLPQEALDEAGVDRADLLARRSTPAFEAMVRHLAEQAGADFGRRPVPPVLHPAIGITLTTYIDLYRLQLRAVAAAPAALLHRRPALSRAAGLRLLLPARARAAVAWALYPFPAQPCPVSAPPPPATADGTAPARRQHTLPTQRRPPAQPAPHPSGARPPRLPAENMPHHVAVVMDGNGRWATSRGLPRTDGHRKGADALIDVVHGAAEIGVEYLTLYAFSTENWKRPPEELHALMYEIPHSLQRLEDDCQQLNVRVRWAGSPSRLPLDVVEALTEAEQATRDCTGLTVTVCVNYGGRAEITTAAARLAQDAVTGTTDLAAISEHVFARYLHVPELPDVDLLLRTGGDRRVSNFLPWQAAYAELVFLDTYWPDVDRRDLWHAIHEYAQRTRRYGRAPHIPTQSTAGSTAGQSHAIKSP